MFDSLIRGMLLQSFRILAEGGVMVKLGMRVILGGTLELADGTIQPEQLL